MDILIVEDDENKLREVSGILSGVPGLRLVLKRSYQSGLKEIVDNPYNLIVLDMSMPTYDKSSSEPGGRFRKFAGKEILAEINRRKIRTKVLLVTAFDTFGEGSTFVTLKELDKKLSALFPNVYLGCVFYNVSENNWSEELLYHVVNAEEVFDV